MRSLEIWTKQDEMLPIFCERRFSNAISSIWGLKARRNAAPIFEKKTQDINRKAILEIVRSKQGKFCPSF